MQFVVNTTAVLVVMLISFQLSLFLSRGLLSLMLLSMHRLGSRIRKQSSTTRIQFNPNNS
jgi:hypothetical protein